MSRAALEAAQPLLRGISQHEVDFVIPRVGIDVPVGIDPFLLFKSRDPDFQVLHRQILDVFRSGINSVQNRELDRARQLFQFPEVAEIGLGYARGGKKGSGVGAYLSELILDTLSDSPAVLERGIRHVEELQLVSVGIGPDRVSDIAANLIKEFLIVYTQKQCALWNIPVQRGVPVSHIFDHDSGDWRDGYFDLPTSTIDSSAILLVPRRIVRALPWINYDDFLKLEFTAYLRAKRTKQSRGNVPLNSTTEIKREIVAVTRREIERVDRYIRLKEETAAQAQPTTSFVDEAQYSAETERLKAKLASIPSGRENAAEYQLTVLEILNYLFNPELIDGELEVRTLEGTERRDIVFTNDSDMPFWDYVRGEHSGLLIMFETKNMNDIGPAALNQTGTYLGDRLGRLGFLASRNPPAEPAQRKAFSIYNDSTPRKVIVFLSDADLRQMLDQKAAGNSPTRHVQNLYRRFRTSVQ